MKPLGKDNICCFCGEKFEKDFAKDKKCCRCRDYCHITDDYRSPA